MRREEILSLSQADTDDAACKLAESISGGELILSSGPLGAGKTAFFKGLARALGVKRTVNSPTFNLIKVYKGFSLTLYHVDCYRLEGVGEEEKGLYLDDLLGEKDSLIYVEWPLFAPKLIIDHHPRIELDFEVLDEETRRIGILDERQ